MSKTGTVRPRIERPLQLAWLWLQHQPKSALAQWFHRRLPGMTGDACAQAGFEIAALARKLFVALWKFTAPASSSREPS